MAKRPTSQELVNNAKNLPLEERYRKLAKAADQRLVRLEAASRERNFKTATKWAYAKAARDIRSWGGDPDRPRFNQSLKGMSETQMRERIAEVEEFILSKTSTKQGIIEVYKKKADTLNKGGKEGQYKDAQGFSQINITWEQLAELAQQGAFDKNDSNVPGSDTVILTLARYQKNKRNIIRDIKKSIKPQQHMTDAAAKREMRKELISKKVSPDEATRLTNSVFNKSNLKDLITVSDKLGVDLPGNKIQQQDLRQVAYMGDIDWDKIM